MHWIHVLHLHHMGMVMADLADRMEALVGLTVVLDHTADLAAGFLFHCHCLSQFQAMDIPLIGGKVNMAPSIQGRRFH